MSFSKEEGVISNEHLSFDQIRGVASEGLASLPAAAGVHLGECRQCAELVKLVNGLGELKPDPATDLGDCPSQVALLEITEGLTVPDTSLYRHITQCRRCVTTLREFAEDLKDDDVPETKNLRTASPGWQRALAGRIASSAESTFRESQRSPLSWFRIGQGTRWAYAVATGIVFCLAVVSWLVWRSRPSYADRLLTEAYTAQRTMELRISGAGYAPLHVQRGSSRFDRPASLLEAEEIIARKLAAHPNDPDWLQAKARADLLEGDYDSSIKALENALEERPESPELLVDLASAYFQRAEAVDHPIDYGKAVDILGRALSKRPDDPVALFNRAVASEKLFLFTQAVDDWEHYLRVDPSSDWAKEARRRLDDLRTKLRNHAESWSEPLLSAREVAGATAENGLLQNRIDQRIEEYLEIALGDWLPKAYPLQVSEASPSDFQKALTVLADISARLHDDRWLADLLSGTAEPSFPHAVWELSSALSANKSGDTVAARRHAAEADRLFAVEGNTAGIERSVLEEVFASQLDQNGSQCLHSATAISRMLEKSSHRWLQIQFHLEKGTCFMLAGDLGSTKEFYAQAAEEAETSEYKLIFLRTQDHASTLDCTVGALPSSWARTRRALDRFWSAPYPPMRGYNLYYSLFECSRVAGEPYLQEAVWRDGVALSDTFNNNTLRAMAHVFMADAATAIEAPPQVVERELAEASRFFSTAPQIRATRIARTEAETRMAGIEVEQQKLQQAIERLRRVEAEVAELSDRFLAIMYYATLGDAEARIGHGDQAETALRLGIGLAELQLRSLRDDKSRREWSKKSSGAYRALTQWRLDQGKTLEALEIWEWFRDAPSRVRGKPIAPLSRRSNAIEAIQFPYSDSLAGIPALPDPQAITREMAELTQETVVSYARLPRGLAIWVYDNRGISFFWSTIAAKRSDVLVQRFQRLCSEPNSDISALRQAARELYDLLISPIERALSPERSLIFDADETFGAIPFDALVDQKGRYLSERVPILNSVGSYHRAAARKSKPITADSVALIVAVPLSRAITDVPLAPLPDAQREAELVARSFHRGQLLMGSGATLNSVRRNLPSAEVFHFAGHAVASPRYSGLFLEDGLFGTLPLGEENLAQVRLAVLSGCDTLGGVGSSYEPDGLVRAFMDAGVAEVIASRWSVDSAATRQFMDTFYGSLLAGEGIPNSIRKAQFDLRSTPGMAHPYYWSAFGAFGTN